MKLNNAFVSLSPKSFSLHNISPQSKRLTGYLIVRPPISSLMTRVSLYSHTSTLLYLFSLSFSSVSPTSYPFTQDTLIFQPKMVIMTQNVQDMILGVYPLHPYLQFF